MKKFNLLIIFLAGIFASSNVSAQANAAINLLTQNVGIVSQGGTVFLEVTINNTGPLSPINQYKVRAQISVPSDIASIPATGHTLPAGWAILNNDGSTIRLINGTDTIAANDSRTILIAIQGNTVGGPSSISGQLSFSNGNPPGTAPGTLAGDNIVDNSSISTIQVTDVLPLTLRAFNTALVNCQPVLNWVTENEINSDRFEIERLNQNNSGWTTVGAVAARGNYSTKNEYKLIDSSIAVSAEQQLLYRLKIIDKDGHYKYSQILPVFINCKTTLVFVYPNPVQKGGLFISITGEKGYRDATLLSLSGQVVLKNKLNVGTNYLNIANVANGVYILDVREANGASKKTKVFVQHD